MEAHRTPLSLVIASIQLHQTAVIKVYLPCKIPISPSVGVIEYAIEQKSLIAGDDFKSGQTKIKSVLVDFLVGAGIKVRFCLSCPICCDWHISNIEA